MLSPIISFQSVFDAVTEWWYYSERHFSVQTIMATICISKLCWAHH